MNIWKCPFGQSSVLSSDASNLAEVLNQLQANHRRMAHFNGLIRRVFPQTHAVSVKPVSTSEVGVFLWTASPDSEREDLLVPLSEAGTGIGQVLAMLYVVVASPSGRVILIDEPNSFLHPGAVRELIGICKEHTQHQYIVTTHTPMVVSAAEPYAILSLGISDSRTTCESVGADDVGQLRGILRDLGVSLSDVFGATSVLWVEGATEELAIPLILKRLEVDLPRNIVILGVRATGDFLSRPRATFEIYRRLSTASVILPPAIGFLFDAERLSQTDRSDLVRQSKGQVAFLARRCFENYLLDPAAIAKYLAGIQGLAGRSADEVARFFDQVGSEKTYGGISRATEPERWVQEVDAARLLHHLFDSFSGGTVEFRKTEHSVGPNAGHVGDCRGCV